MEGGYDYPLESAGKIPFISLQVISAFWRTMILRHFCAVFDRRYAKSFHIKYLDIKSIIFKYLEKTAKRKVLK
jgi:hypothetical protein